MRVIATEIVYPLRKYVNSECRVLQISFCSRRSCDEAARTTVVGATDFGFDKGGEGSGRDSPSSLQDRFSGKAFSGDSVKKESRNLSHVFSGQDAKKDKMYICPLIVDSDWQFGPPTTQHLLDRYVLALCLELLTQIDALGICSNGGGAQRAYPAAASLWPAKTLQADCSSSTN